MANLSLVRWCNEDGFGVMPLTAVKEGSPYPGALVSMKWGKKAYEAEILKISCNRKELEKDCDDLIYLRKNPDDFLKEAESVVDSTTDVEDTPPKKARYIHTKMTAAKCRARESIDFKDTPPGKKVKLSKQPPLSKNGACKSRPKPLVVDNVDTQAVPSKKLSKKTPNAKLAAAKRRARDLFQNADKQQHEALKERIRQLEEQLALTSPVVVTKNVVSNSSFDSIQKSVYQGFQKGYNSLEFTEQDFDDVSWDPDVYGHMHSTPQDMSTSSKGSFSCDEFSPNYVQKESSRREDCYDKRDKSPIEHHGVTHKVVERTPSCPIKQKDMSKQLDLLSGVTSQQDKIKIEPPKIELVPGYGILLTKRQLDEAIQEGNNSPTRIIRNLLSIFFSREELAQSSCYGSRGNKP